MNLFQEYARRHRLSCPLIKRPDKYLFLLYRANKVTYKRDWVLLNIGIKNEANHPSYFTFNWQVPKSNGVLTGHVFENFTAEQRVEWDEYEKEVMSVSRKSDLKPVNNLAEVKLLI